MLHTSRPSKEEVNLAVQGLRNIVDRVLKRCDDLTCQKCVDGIFKHMIHCLWKLSIKRDSLRIGFSVLSNQVWPELLQRLKSIPISLFGTRNAESNNKAQNLLHKELTNCLHHFFTQLLRFHDGLILVTSGECRHPGDVEQAKQTRFWSRLNASATSTSDETTHFRPDGYTQLYSPDCTYSGYGWDELMDESNGLHKRLVNELLPGVPPSLRRQGVWNWMMEKDGGQCYENLLDCIEGLARGIDFKALVDRVKIDLKAVLQPHNGSAPVLVEVSLADKLETMKVTMGRSYHCQLSRFASDFKISGSDGVLPSLSPNDWLLLLKMQPPAEEVSHDKTGGRKYVKKRLVIQDSDTEEDSDAKFNDDVIEPKPNGGSRHQETPLVSGVVVQIRKANSTAGKSDQSNDYVTSLDDIKEKHGVDKEVLALAREELEAEEAVTELEAATIDNASHGQDGNESLSIEQASRVVTRLKRALKRELRRSKIVDYDVWDCREKLREALIQAGNTCLWSEEYVDAPELQRNVIEKAIQYFTEGQRLIEDQERLLVRIALTQPAEETSFFRRNLMLLLGRAYVNAGIARIELCRLRSIKQSERETHLRRALLDVNRAISLAESLKELARNDREGEKFVSDSDVDVIRSIELKCLAVRWKGCACWTQGRLDEAVKLFNLVAAVLNELDCTQSESDINLFEANLKVMAECYFASSSLADMALSLIDCAAVDTIRINMSKYVKLFEIADCALEKAFFASSTLHGYICQRFGNRTAADNILEDHGVLEALTIEDIRTNVKDWWTQRQLMSSRQIEPGSFNYNLPRNDLSIMDDITRLPTARLLLNGAVRRSKGKKTHGAGYSNTGISQKEKNFDDNPSKKSSHRKYRKWGDELLPQTTDAQGRVVPLLCYPAVAPEMPPEIKALLAAKNC